MLAAPPRPRRLPTRQRDALIKGRYPAPDEFGYDAVESKPGRRRPSPMVNRSEDAELPPQKRANLVAQTREIHRNFTAAAWMVRRHLDYCATFSFQAKTGDRILDKQVEALVESLEEPENWDVAGRHGISSYTRLAEGRRILDGDIGTIKLRSGLTQTIEGDRVRNPEGAPWPDHIEAARLNHGLLLGDYGNTLAYAVHRRIPTTAANPTASRFEFERMVPARSMYWHAYYDRFDQVRGISPLAPAVNTLVDLYEGIDYALAKLKISQLFALAFFRGDPLSITPGTTDVDGRQDYTKIPLDGPKILDLDMGDRAEVLDAKTPSTEFQSFTTLLLQLVLKALDIPYSLLSVKYHEVLQRGCLNDRSESPAKHGENGGNAHRINFFAGIKVLSQSHITRPGLDVLDVRHCGSESTVDSRSLLSLSGDSAGEGVAPALSTMKRRKCGGIFVWGART